MLSFFLKAFDVLRDNRKTRSDRHRQFLEELVTFCGDSDAAIAQFYLARERDAAGPRSDATMAAVINVQKPDSVAQRLQLRARTTFQNSEVPHMLFELLRRISHSKQFLIIAEPAYLRAGFLADQQWVQYQVRRTVAAAARESGLNLDQPDLPFLIGFHAATELPPGDSDYTEQAPSIKIMSDHNRETVKAKWESLGHKWNPEW